MTPSGKKEKAIRILAEKNANFDVQTDVRSDNRASPAVASLKEKAVVRVEARVSIFEFPNKEKVEARMVRTSKASAEASSFEEAEDLAVFRSIANLGLLEGEVNE